MMVIVKVDVVAKSDKSYYPRPSPAPSADMAAVKLQNRLVASKVLIFMDMIMFLINFIVMKFARLRLEDTICDLSDTCHNSLISSRE